MTAGDSGDSVSEAGAGGKAKMLHADPLEETAGRGAKVVRPGPGNMFVYGLNGVLDRHYR